MLRPSPQQFTGIDFALVRTRELAGLLVPGTRVATPAGVGLELRDAMSGALHTARSFSDGAFYFSRVRPGSYRLSLAQSSSTALGITSPPQLEVLVGTEGADILDLPPITLNRAVPSASP